jgi:hypothetical protein
LGYVDNLFAFGSTNINEALLEALDLFDILTVSGSARIIVFLTDGLPTTGVTDEDQIATNVKNANAALDEEASIYVFGVGHDVNTHLLDKISGKNHGFSIYISPDQSLEDALVDFYSKIENPILTDVSISFSEIEVSEVYPRDIPDLFEGSQIVLVGRFSTSGDMTIVEKTIEDPSNELKYEHIAYGIVIELPSAENITTVTVVVSGNTPNGSMKFSYEFELIYADYHDFIPKLWATRRIGDLVNQIRLEGEKEELVEEIKALGIKYGIVSPYTSMVIKARSGTLQEYMIDPKVLSHAWGAASFNQAVANQAYNFAKQADISQGTNVKAQGGKIFLDLDGTLIDMELLSGTDIIRLDNQTVQEWVAKNIRVTRYIALNSTKYFEFALENNMEEVLAAGDNIVFYHQGEVIQVSSGLGIAKTSGGDETVPTVTISKNGAMPHIALLVCLGLVAGSILVAVSQRR